MGTKSLLSENASTSHSRLFKSATLLASGQIMGYGLSFVRNILLARYLTKADFGMTSIFALTISFLEISGRMAFGQQCIQSKQGSLPSFENTSHAFQCSLSTVGAILVLLSSYPAALIFHVPEATWAFACLAIIPFIKGFEHLDNYRLQRHMIYMPGVLYEVVPQFIITLATWPLLLWLGDYRVIIILIILKALLALSMSHITAERPYRWNWNADHIRSLWRFGSPLLLNGIVLFFCQQSDQALVGSMLSLESLATYTLVCSLVSIPWMMFGQVGTSILLPVLSRLQDNKNEFQKQYVRCIEYSGLFAMLLTAPLIIGGEQIVTALYGTKYRHTGLLMGILGLAACIRFLRFSPAIAAMAVGDTKNQLQSNLVRCISLILILVVLLLHGGVAFVSFCILIAEISVRLPRFDGQRNG